MKSIKQPNYYCLHCPHSGAMHSGPKMLCGGLDAAGDTCDCSPFVADLSRPPMADRKPTRIRPDVVRASRAAALRAKLRYRIMSDDSGHEYFVPTDEEKIFDLWLKTFEDDWDPEFNEYLGPDYENNRIDGRFTFTDPKVG